jgi:hypothetical protein
MFCLVVLCDKIFFFVTGVPHTQFEKMFMMFDDDVWFVITITFTLGLIFIQLISFCSQKIQIWCLVKV